MNELALFAGAGGGLLATKHLLGWRTICYVEFAEYPIAVLKARIADGYLDDAPIWDDARTFDGQPWCGCVDIVTAGFPCQPFSVAGRQRADADERNMWPDTIRIIREVHPPFVLLENVPGLLSRSHGYFGQILGDLAESGYDARWRVLSAAEVGAPHKRDRLFIVGRNAKSCANGAVRVFQGWENSQPCRVGTDVAYAPQQFGDGGNHNAKCRSQQIPQPGNGAQETRSICGWWQVEPDVGRVANGVASRVDRLKAIGNGQVPLVVAAVWELLMGA